MNGYKTIIAAAVALAAEVSRLAGLDIDVAGVTNSVVTIAGLVGAIVFRYTASRDIKRGGLLQKD